MATLYSSCEISTIPPPLHKIIYLVLRWIFLDIIDIELEMFLRLLVSQFIFSFFIAALCFQITCVFWKSESCFKIIIIMVITRKVSFTNNELLLGLLPSCNVEHVILNSFYLLFTPQYFRDFLKNRLLLNEVELDVLLSFLWFTEIL